MKLPLLDRAQSQDLARIESKCTCLFNTTTVAAFDDPLNLHPQEEYGRLARHQRGVAHAGQEARHAATATIAAAAGGGRGGVAAVSAADGAPAAAGAAAQQCQESKHLHLLICFDFDMIYKQACYCDKL